MPESHLSLMGPAMLVTAPLMTVASPTYTLFSCHWLTSFSRLYWVLARDSAALAAPLVRRLALRSSRLAPGVWAFFLACLVVVVPLERSPRPLAANLGLQSKSGFGWLVTVGSSRKRR